MQKHWYHVALVLRDAGPLAAPDKPGKLELYLDGRKIASAPGAQIATHGNGLNIGRNMGSRMTTTEVGGVVDNFFKGMVGEIRVYNRALSPEEIAGLAK
jgi:hypothetical protein